MNRSHDLVERVAIAIAEDDWAPAFVSRAMQRICEGADGKYRDVNQPSKDEYRDMARAAIAAFLAAARSEGWVMCHPEEKISEGALKAGNEAALSIEVLVGNRRFSCERATYTAILRAKLAEEG